MPANRDWWADSRVGITSVDAKWHTTRGKGKGK